RLLGVDSEAWIARIGQGDPWSVFLKVSSSIEVVLKRAVALTEGGDPDDEEVTTSGSYKSLVACKDLGLIGDEGFAFANAVRKARNELVHAPQAFEFDLRAALGSAYAEYYGAVDGFISIEGSDGIENATEQLHLNVLLMGAMWLFANLAESVLGSN